MRRTRFFLDANILVDAQSRDLLLRIAEVGIIDVRWSEKILDETGRALAALIEDEHRRTRLVDAMRNAFPEAAVVGYEYLESSLSLPDTNDRHVLAAAAVSECDVLVTNNLKDFPDAICDRFDIVAVDVDEALLIAAAEAGPHLEHLVRSQIAAMRRPEMTSEDFVRRLATRAPQAAMLIGNALGVETYRRMLAEVLRADSADGPQQTVRSLLSALRKGDAITAFALVAPELRHSLAPIDPDNPVIVMAALVDALEDALTSEGWGFATAWRPQSPDVELVKLVRGGDHARITDGPQLMQGHLFYVRRLPSGWQLTDLDGPDPGLAEQHSASDAGG